MVFEKCYVLIVKQMENERYLESKLVSNSFASYLDLTPKAYEFMSKPESMSIKILETVEMKEASAQSTQARSNVLVPGFKLINQTHNQ